MKHEFVINLLFYFFTAFFFLFSFSNKSHAQLVSSDDNYYVYEEGPYRIIYPEIYRKHIQTLDNLSRKIKSLYDTEYDWTLDEKPTLVLASPRHQIANGFATNHPRLRTVFYPSAGDLIEEFSSTSWMSILLAHETAHLHQINVKHGYSKILKRLFGNSLPGGLGYFLPPFTYTLHPNEFLPTFATEGNATFNENRFGNGGRLYSGAHRALILSVAKKNLIKSDRIFNDNLEFPFGREKYLIGGYFNLYLAKTYGINKTNLFFNIHAKREFNPLAFNAAFIDNFGVDYQTALTEFNSELKKMWSKQKNAPEKPIFTSIQHPGFTSSGNEVRFLVSDGIRLPRLKIYDTRKKNWKSLIVNMPLGRVFKDDKKNYAAVSSEAVSNNLIAYNLFSDGYSFNEKSHGQIVYDQKGEQLVFADAIDSFFSTTVKNQEGAIVTNQAASSAITDNNGNIFYFLQEGKKRILFKNDKPLFSYMGYYGFPVEALNNDRLLFIGPTEFGSTIFMWSENKITRLHFSDQIIDARYLHDKTILIAEVHADGYQYKKILADPSADLPFEYTYFFEESKDINLIAHALKENLSSQKNTATKENVISDRPYKIFSDLQFDGIDPFVYFGVDTAAIASLAFRFSDPLQRHSMAFFLSSGSFGEFGAGAQYFNQEYIVNWDLLFAYQRRAEVEEDTTELNNYNILDQYDTWIGGIGFSYNFFRRPQWASGLKSHLVYEYEKPNISISNADKAYTLTSQWITEHHVQPALAFKPYRLFYLEFAHDNIYDAPEWANMQNRYAGLARASYDMIYQTYLTASYQSSFTDSSSPIVELKSSTDDFLFSSATFVSRNTRFAESNYFIANKFSAELEQALNLSLYFTKFPLALRRFSVIGAYNEYYGSTANKRKPETLFHEVGGGVNLELLLFHKLPFRIKILNFKTNFDDSTNTLVVAGANGAF